MSGKPDIPKSLLHEILEEMLADLEKQDGIEEEIISEFRQLAEAGSLANRKQIMKAIKWLPEAGS